MEIKRLGSLSLETAIALFNLKVTLVASYAIELIWPYLNYSNIKALDRVKARYLKKTLSVSKHAPTRLVYQLAGIPNFVEDLISKHNLRPTQICEKFLEEQAQKVTEIEPAFYRTPAMTEGEWQTAGYELRHLYTQGQYTDSTNVYAAELASTTLTVNVFVNSETTMHTIPPIRMNTNNFTNLTL